MLNINKSIIDKKEMKNKEKENKTMNKESKQIVRNWIIDVKKVHNDEYNKNFNIQRYQQVIKK